MNSIIDNYTEEELEQIVKLSNSYRDLAKKIGYTSFSGDLKIFLEEKTKNFDKSHFNTNNVSIKRNEENIFIENSTVAQKTLRKWYKEKGYTLYQCSICGQEPIWQGKELTLILDHINGINNDDRLENLRWVCPNCNQQLDTTNGKNRKSYIKKYYCIDCGKEISKGSNRCVECFSKQQIKSINDLPVNRDTLKDLIRNKSFTEIGKIYQVSDNAIRKWCDKLNLPRTKREIKTYSDKEWFLI